METCLPLVLPLLESNFERGSALSRVFPRHPLPVPLGISPSAHTSTARLGQATDSIH